MPMEKQCEWCGRTFAATKPTSKTCSKTCSGRLTAANNGRTADRSAPMPGFDFLDDDDFVTSTELASLLGIASHTVGDWIRDGRISAPTSQGSSRGRPITLRVGDVRKLLAQLADGSD